MLSSSAATDWSMCHSGCMAATGFVLHPGGKAFVEPDVVPPLHGDQVAEPLVRHLMSDDDGDLLFGADGGGFGIEEQVGFAVGDGAEVLHGAGFEVGQRDQVELLERIGNAEVVVVVVQHVLGNIDAVGRERNLVGRGADADGYAVLTRRRCTGSRRPERRRDRWTSWAW